MTQELKFLAGESHLLRMVQDLSFNSHLAPVALPARELIPWLIVKVLSRGLKAYRTRISVHFNGL
jgi:hypothetical protein